ncbi:hypothetical protein ACQWG3_24770, partial [Salmonella enterica subsp. enterica serovar Infantis]
IFLSILSRCMGDDGFVLDSGVQSVLFSAWVGRHCFVTTRSSDLLLMFVFDFLVLRQALNLLVDQTLIFYSLLLNDLNFVMI